MVAIQIATLVRRALAEVCTVPVLLVVNCLMVLCITESLIGVHKLTRKTLFATLNKLTCISLRVPYR